MTGSEPRRWKPHWPHEKVDPERCRASVHDDTGVGFHQCHRKPRPGSEWCGQHSPEAIARREAKRKAREEEEVEWARKIRSSLNRELDFLGEPESWLDCAVELRELPDFDDERQVAETIAVFAKKLIGGN